MRTSILRTFGFIMVVVGLVLTTYGHLAGRKCVNCGRPVPRKPLDSVHFQPGPPDVFDDRKDFGRHDNNRPGRFGPNNYVNPGYQKAG